MSALDLSLDPDVVKADRLRGHAFQPPADVIAAIPALYATEATEAADKTIHLHYFVAGWDWWIAELDPETWEAFGCAASPMCPRGEWGYIPLAELASLTGVFRAGIPMMVERDLWWSPRPFSEAKPR